MDRTLLPFLLLLSYGFAFIDSQALISVDVIGAVLIQCGKPVLHTKRGSDCVGTVMTNDPSDKCYSSNSQFLPDWNTTCLKGPAEILHYCHKLYGGINRPPIRHAVSAPFAIPINHWPGTVVNVPRTMENQSLWVRPYWCIVINQSSSTETGSEQNKLDWHVTQLESSHQSKLPSLIELHKAVFDSQFHKLDVQTNQTIQHFLHHFIEEAHGFAQLNQSNHDLARYLASDMLQRAHGQLDAVWSNQENEWSNLEFGEHVDLVKQFQREDMAGQNEFVYALQEPNPTTERVQDALTRYLSALADSVNEEIRHLEAVSHFQPWTLSLNPSGNWTAQLNQQITNIYQVHATVVSCVKRATVAINALHSFANKHLDTDNFQMRYKQSLINQYNRLQSALIRAKQTLEQAKRKAVDKFSSHAHFLNDSTRLDSQFMEDRQQVIRRKHRSELAYVDNLLLGLTIPPNRHPVFAPVTNPAIWMPSDEFHHVIVRSDHHPTATESTQRNKTIFFVLMLSLKIMAAWLCLIGLIIIAYLLIRMLCKPKVAYPKQLRRSLFDDDDTLGSMPNGRRHSTFWSMIHGLKHHIRHIQLLWASPKSNHRTMPGSDSCKHLNVVIQVSSGAVVSTDTTSTQPNANCQDFQSPVECIKGYVNPICA